MDSEQETAARVDLDVLMEQMRGYPPTRIAEAMWEWMEAQGFREKAHTPTDDEREAPTQELCDRCGWAISGHLRSQYGLDCPPGGSRPDFRRSEVPEPSRIGCNVCGEALPDGEPHVCSEPQGEPSDAQVDAAQLALAHSGHSVYSKEGMRAALRAAGGVR